VKKFCYSFLSKNQRCQLKNSHPLFQYMKINSDKFQNTFRWRSVYVQIENNHTDLLSSTFDKTSHSTFFHH
jgi:hypothetical protein